MLLESGYTMMMMMTTTTMTTMRGRWRFERIGAPVRPVHLLQGLPDVVDVQQPLGHGGVDRAVVAAAGWVTRRGEGA